jgi:hypothetical protein
MHLNALLFLAGAAESSEDARDIRVCDIRVCLPHLYALLQLRYRYRYVPREPDEPAAAAGCYSVDRRPAYTSSLTPVA